MAMMITMAKYELVSFHFCKFPDGDKWMLRSKLVCVFFFYYLPPLIWFASHSMDFLFVLLWNNNPSFMRNFDLLFMHKIDSHLVSKNHRRRLQILLFLLLGEF